MEEEAEKIRQIQTEADKQINISSPPGSTTSAPIHLTIEEKMEADARSVYVGNVSSEYNYFRLYFGKIIFK